MILFEGGGTAPLPKMLYANGMELVLVVASYHYCLNRHSAATVLQILRIA